MVYELQYVEKVVCRGGFQTRPYMGKFQMNNKGFSLIEMVMVIILLGVIAAVGAMVLLEGVDSWVAVEHRKEAMDEARMAMERMVREIRGGRRYNYTFTSSQDITFRQYSSKSDTGPKVIRYNLSGQNLIRTEGGVPNTIASYVTFCNFSVYNPNLIRIRLKSTVSNKTVELRDTAFFRNYTGTE